MRVLRSSRLATSGSGTIRATIAGSVAAGATFDSGLKAEGAGTKVTVINSKAVNNGVGLNVTTGATMYISETTAAANLTAGFFYQRGSLQTFGDNYIIDTTNTGSLTPIAGQ
jgi:hypothetical protein